MVVGKIMFKDPADINKFVNIVSKKDYDVDVKDGSTVLDGKSLQGLFAMQLNKKLVCVLHESIDKCHDIIDQLAEFSIESFAEVAK